MRVYSEIDENMFDWENDVANAIVADESGSYATSLTTLPTHQIDQRGNLNN